MNTIQNSIGYPVNMFRYFTSFFYSPSEFIALYKSNAAAAAAALARGRDKHGCV